MTRIKRIISLVTLAAFLFNTIAYGMSPIVASGPLGEGGGTREDMHALGQKLFAAKRGPGAIDFDAVKPFPFRGREPMVEWTDFNVKTNYSKPPADWGKNKLLEITDLKKAFEYFRDYEARIPKELLDIEVGRFDVDMTKGELPISCIEKRKGRYTLVIHEDFVRMWDDIRANDVWLDYTFPDGKKRTLSVAWGIFFRVAKHEMGDLAKRNLIPKSEGHINYSDIYKSRPDYLDYLELSSETGEAMGLRVLGKDQELRANMINGRYKVVNDAIWAWFLGSYCFTNLTRYDNDTLEKRLNWFFEGKEAREMKLNLEFPNLLSDDKVREHAVKLALGINYRYFGKSGAEALKFRPEEMTPQEKNVDRFASILADYLVTKNADLSNALDYDPEEREAAFRLVEYVKKMTAYIILHRGYNILRPQDLDAITIKSDRLQAARVVRQISDSLDAKLRYLAIDAVTEVFKDSSSLLSQKIRQLPVRLTVQLPGTEISEMVDVDEAARIREDVFGRFFGQPSDFVFSGSLRNRMLEITNSMKREVTYQERRPEIADTMFATGDSETQNQSLRSGSGQAPAGEGEKPRSGFTLEFADAMEKALRASDETTVRQLMTEDFRSAAAYRMVITYIEPKTETSRAWINTFTRDQIDMYDRILSALSYEESSSSRDTVTSVTSDRVPASEDRYLQNIREQLVHDGAYAGLINAALAIMSDPEARLLNADAYSEYNGNRAIIVIRNLALSERSYGFYINRFETKDGIRYEITPIHGNAQFETLRTANISELADLALQALASERRSPRWQKAVKAARAAAEIEDTISQLRAAANTQIGVLEEMISSLYKTDRITIRIAFLNAGYKTDEQIADLNLLFTFDSLSSTDRLSAEDAIRVRIALLNAGFNREEQIANLKESVWSRPMAERVAVREAFLKAGYKKAEQVNALNSLLAGDNVSPTDKIRMRAALLNAGYNRNEQISALQEALQYGTMPTTDRITIHAALLNAGHEKEGQLASLKMMLEHGDLPLPAKNLVRIALMNAYLKEAKSLEARLAAEAKSAEPTPVEEKMQATQAALDSLRPPKTESATEPTAEQIVAEGVSPVAITMLEIPAPKISQEAMLDVINNALKNKGFSPQDQFNEVRSKLAENSYVKLVTVLDHLKYLISAVNISKSFIIQTINAVTVNGQSLSELERLFVRKAFLGDSEGGGRSDETFDSAFLHGGMYVRLSIISSFPCHTGLLIDTLKGYFDRRGGEIDKILAGNAADREIRVMGRNYYVCRAGAKDENRFVISLFRDGRSPMVKGVIEQRKPSVAQRPAAGGGKTPETASDEWRVEREFASTAKLNTAMLTEKFAELKALFEQGKPDLEDVTDMISQLEEARSEYWDYQATWVIKTPHVGRPLLNTIGLCLEHVGMLAALIDDAMDGYGELKDEVVLADIKERLDLIGEWIGTLSGIVGRFYEVVNKGLLADYSATLEYYVANGTQTEEIEKILGPAYAQSVAELLQNIKDTTRLTVDSIEITDRTGFVNETVDYLAREAALSQNPDVKASAQRILREAAASFNVKLASIHDFYTAKTAGEWANITVPAVNGRTDVYNQYRQLFRAAKEKSVGALVLELARSEMRYSAQDAAEFSAISIAAAIRQGYGGLLFVQGDHYQVNREKYDKGTEEREKELQSIETLIRKAMEAGIYNIDIDPSTLVDESALKNILAFETDVVDRYLNLNPQLIVDLDENGVRSVRRRLVDEIEMGNLRYFLTPEDQHYIQEQYRLMHATTAEVTMRFIRYIRKMEKELGFPEGMHVSIGIEERHIDKPEHKNNPSTVLGSMTLAQSILAACANECLVGPSKLSLQTGTMHGVGGEVDFGIYQRHLEFQKKIGLAVFVQHGASTLEKEDFDKMRDGDVGEVHLATEYQKIELGIVSRLMPRLGEEMAKYLIGMMDKDPKMAAKFRSKWDVTFAQAGKNKAAIITEMLGDTLPKGLKGTLKDLVKELPGPFKTQLWNLPPAVRKAVDEALYEEFSTIFEKLGATNTLDILGRIIPFDKQPVILGSRSNALQDAVAQPRRPGRPAIPGGSPAQALIVYGLFPDIFLITDGFGNIEEHNTIILGYIGPVSDRTFRRDRQSLRDWGLLEKDENDDRRSIVTQLGQRKATEFAQRIRGVAISMLGDVNVGRYDILSLIRSRDERIMKLIDQMDRELRSEARSAATSAKTTDQAHRSAAWQDRPVGRQEALELNGGRFMPIVHEMAAGHPDDLSFGAAADRQAAEEAMRAQEAAETPATTAEKRRTTAAYTVKVMKHFLNQAVSYMGNLADPQTSPAISKNKRRQISPRINKSKSAVAELELFITGRSATDKPFDGIPQRARSCVDTVRTEMGRVIEILKLNRAWYPANTVYNLLDDAAALADELEKLIRQPKVRNRYRVPKSPASAMVLFGLFPELFINRVFPNSIHEGTAQRVFNTGISRSTFRSERTGLSRYGLLEPADGGFFLNEAGAAKAIEFAGRIMQLVNEHNLVSASTDADTKRELIGQLITAGNSHLVGEIRRMDDELRVRSVVIMLRETKPLVFSDLVGMVRNPQHKPAVQSEEILRRFQVLNTKGEVGESVAAIVRAELLSSDSGRPEYASETQTAVEKGFAGLPVSQLPGSDAVRSTPPTELQAGQAQSAERTPDEAAEKPTQTGIKKRDPDSRRGFLGFGFGREKQEQPDAVGILLEAAEREAQEPKNPYMTVHTKGGYANSPSWVLQQVVGYQDRILEEYFPSYGKWRMLGRGVMRSALYIMVPSLSILVLGIFAAMIESSAGIVPGKIVIGMAVGGGAGLALAFVTGIAGVVINDTVQKKASDIVNLNQSRDRSDNKRNAYTFSATNAVVTSSLLVAVSLAVDIAMGEFPSKLFFAAAAIFIAASLSKIIENRIMSKTIQQIKEEQRAEARGAESDEDPIRTLFLRLASYSNAVRDAEYEQNARMEPHQSISAEERMILPVTTQADAMSFLEVIDTEPIKEVIGELGKSGRAPTIQDVIDRLTESGMFVIEDSEVVYTTGSGTEETINLENWAAIIALLLSAKPGSASETEPAPADAAAGVSAGQRLGEPAGPEAAVIEATGSAKTAESGRRSKIIGHGEEAASADESGGFTVIPRRQDDAIVVGNNIIIKVVSVKSGYAKVAITAPKDAEIMRAELGKPSAPSSSARSSECATRVIPRAASESIWIGNDILLKLADIRGGDRAMLGLKVPEGVSIQRGEVVQPAAVEVSVGQRLGEPAGQAEAIGKEPSAEKTPYVQRATGEEQRIHIPEAIDIYAARIGFETGPGSKIEPDALEIASFYKMFDMLESVRVEIYLSQEREKSLKQTLRDDIAALNRRIRQRNQKEEDAISIKQMPSDDANIRKILSQRDDGVKRIFVNDDTTIELFRTLIGRAGGSELLKGNRLFAADIGKGEDDIEDSVRQAWLIKVSILSALLTQENKGMIGTLLEPELNGRVTGRAKDFINNMASTENEMKSTEVINRVNYFLGHMVKLSAFIAEQLRILKAFWVAA